MLYPHIPVSRTTMSTARCVPRELLLRLPKSQRKDISPGLKKGICDLVKDAAQQADFVAFAQLFRSSSHGAKCSDAGVLSGMDYYLQLSEKSGPVNDRDGKVGTPPGVLRSGNCSNRVNSQPSC